MSLTQTLHRSARLLLVLGVLASCSASGANLGEARPELGSFRLCHNVVTTNDAVQGPLSREADLDRFAEIMRAEVARRFGRYEGDRLYHLSMHIDAYVLAVPGVPLVASPRSALVTSVFVWDDALGRPLNEEREQFTILESAGEATLVGSGLTQTAEEQMAHLARNAALRIETWLAEHPEWFDHPPVDPATRPAAGSGPTTDPCARD